MKILGVIPARYKSSRFPGKPLAIILDKPLIIHVVEKAVDALGRDNVLVATDDKRIFDEVKKWSYTAIMTPDNLMTGTDRVWEVAKKVRADIYVNIQGDEPMVKPEDIKKIVDEKIKNPKKIINGYCPLSADEDPYSPNIPKVVFGEDNSLLYMSRAAIPATKDKEKKPVYNKQVCIYAYDYNELKAFGSRNKKTYSESFEDIEILRFLEMGYPIRMVKTSGTSLAVDVPEDIEKVEKSLTKT